MKRILKYTRLYRKLIAATLGDKAEFMPTYSFCSLAVACPLLLHALFSSYALDQITPKALYPAVINV